MMEDDAIPDIKSPQTPWMSWIDFSQQHFPSKDILFLPNLPASKNLLEEQIFWATASPLGAPDHNDKPMRFRRIFTE